MKKAGVKIDIENDSITMFGHHMKLNTNRSGHYTLQLKDVIENGQTMHEHKVLWQVLDGTDLNKDLKALLDMHEGLGHPGRQKFEQMLRVTGNFKESVKILLDKLYEQCLTCHKF